MARQAKDPYIRRAKKEHYRSRAAYKLIEIDDKFSLLRSGQCIVDLGCAPGGWLQVIRKRAHTPDTTIIGIDLLPMLPIEGTTIHTADFQSDHIRHTIFPKGNRGVNVVLSDMAPATTGDRKTDHLRIMNLCEGSRDFALQVLEPDGALVTKIFQGGSEKQFTVSLKPHFKAIHFFKPQSSRKDSVELYILALGFCGNAPDITEF
jgi:23S rRNA (uridine2552-2'-O)-methyltransferase